MATDEKIEKIMNPFIKKDYMEDEIIYGKWDTIKWAFHIFRNRNFKKGKNLIVSSFFLLRDVDEVYAYSRGDAKFKDRLYLKKIKAYFKGLQSITKGSYGKSENLNYRIYCDLTTARLVEKYLSYDHVEIYVYFFPQFFDFDKMTHFGFFGTLVRYLPFFKVENHNNDEWKTTTVVDIDTDFHLEFKLLHFFLDQLRNGKEMPNLYYRNRYCYYLISRLVFMNISPPYFPIISNYVSQQKPQNLKIFTNFLQNCLINSCTEYAEIIKKYLPIDLSKQPMGGRLEFGVDEFFMNAVFLRECYYDQNRDILLNVVGDVGGGLTDWIYFLIMNKVVLKNPELVEQFLKTYISLFFPENYKIPSYKDVYELLNIIDKEIYGKDYTYKKKHPKEKYEKLMEIIKKIGPEKLNMSPHIYYCIQKTITAQPDQILFVLIKPNPKYPEFTDTIVDKTKCC